VNVMPYELRPQVRYQSRQGASWAARSCSFLDVERFLPVLVGRPGFETPFSQEACSPSSPKGHRRTYRTLQARRVGENALARTYRSGKLYLIRTRMDGKRTEQHRLSLVLRRVPVRSYRSSQFPMTNPTDDDPIPLLTLLRTTLISRHKGDGHPGRTSG